MRLPPPLNPTAHKCTHAMAKRRHINTHSYAHRAQQQTQPTPSSSSSLPHPPTHPPTPLLPAKWPKGTERPVTPSHSPYSPAPKLAVTVSSVGAGSTTGYLGGMMRCLGGLFWVGGWVGWMSGGGGWGLGLGWMEDHGCGVEGTATHTRSLRRHQWQEEG